MKYALFLLALVAGSVFAAPGLWYEPDRDGHGISITQSEGGFAVIWYLYRDDGQPTFLIADPCPEFPCVSALYEPSARFMGGDLELGEPVGDIEIGTGEPLVVRYDLREWRPETCLGISPGGVLFRECGGRLDLVRLAE